MPASLEVLKAACFQRVLLVRAPAFWKGSGNTAWDTEVRPGTEGSKRRRSRVVPAVLPVDRALDTSTTALRVAMGADA